MRLIEEAIRVARKFYVEDTYYHVMRVAAFVTEDNLIPKDRTEACVALAILHDLQEDTDFNFNTDFGVINLYIQDCLNLLTKDKDTAYKDYLKIIKDNYKNYPEAYWVKLADIKDHLTQTETLTDKLKEKYLTGLPNLL